MTSAAAANEGSLSRCRSLASVAVPGDGRLPVLGESFRSPDPLCRHKNATLKDLGLNVKNLSKLPKLPRPSRTLAVFECAVRGLRDHVRFADGQYKKVCEENAVSNGSNTAKVWSVERQKKKMEYLLSKVEELLEYYTVQNRMREGALHMSRAYESSESTSRKASISNLQCGYRECTQTMCAIEAQLESMLGQFFCKMKGVMGFARVMPGDRFEVTMRLGNQKWKSSGRVGKDNVQTWVDDEKSFKVYSCHSFIIKVFECKLLGRVLLGEKHCDVLGLFAAVPQSLTVDVNSSGTIKLNLVTQWDPLALFSEQMTYFNPPGRTSGRPVSMIGPSSKDESCRHLGSSLGHSTSADLIDRGLRLRHTTGGSTTPFTSSASVRPDLLPPDESAIAECDDEPVGSAGRLRHSSRLCDWPASVEEAIALLRASLELHSGRFLESSASTLGRLQRLAEEIEHFTHCIGERPPSRASSASQTIEHAFDFLNLEDCDDEGSVCRPCINTTSGNDAYPVDGAVVAVVEPLSGDECNCSDSISPHSTARSVAADSGIESYVHTHLSERSLVSTTSNYTVAAECSRPTTGSTELDTVVKQHLECCCLLLEELEASGCLSAREEQLWRRLEQQAVILSVLVKLLKSIAVDPKSVHNLHRVMNDTAPLAKAVYEFWVHHVKEEHPLYMTREQFVLALEKTCAAMVRSKFELQPSKVFAGVANRIIDSDKLFPPHFRPKLVVTVQQFLVKMEELDECSLENLVNDVASELWLLENLKSGNEAVTIRSIQSLQDTIPSEDVLNTLLGLLTTSCNAVSTAVVTYFKNVERSSRSRDIVVSMVATSLAEPRADVRAGACVALEKLKGREAYSQLVETSHTDVSKRIQTMARLAASAVVVEQAPAPL